MFSEFLLDPLSILGIIIVTNNVSLSLRHKFYPRSYTKHFSLSYSPILTHTDQLSHLLCSFFLTPSTHFTNCIFSLNHNTTLTNLSLTYPLVNTHPHPHTLTNTPSLTHTYRQVPKPCSSPLSLSLYLFLNIDGQYLTHNRSFQMLIVVPTSLSSTSSNSFSLKFVQNFFSLFRLFLFS